MIRKQSAIWIGVVLVGLAIIAYVAFTPASNGEAQNRGQLDAVLAAWHRLADAQSAHITAMLDLRLPHANAEAANQPVVDISIQTEGDGIWQEKPQYTGTFSITTKGRGMQLFTDGEIVTLPEQVIFKLANLPTLINPSGNLLNTWTLVDRPILRATNPEEVSPAFDTIFRNWERKGVDGSRVRYEKSFTEEDERVVESAFRLPSSNSHGLHVLARLVKHFNITSAQAWLDSGNNELQQLEFQFAHPTQTEQTAVLQFTFGNPGKKVTITAPEVETTVQPEVFAQLFGT